MEDVKREQLLAAVSFCAEGHRFSGCCVQCPLMPFNDAMCGYCTSCIGNLLHTVRDYIIEKEGKS